MRATVRVERCESYAPQMLRSALAPFEPILAAAIEPGATVALKPNWLAPHHRDDPEVWDSVITHPELISAVLERVVDHLRGAGRVILADAPQTDSSWSALRERFREDDWRRIADAAGVELEILDLRDREYRMEGGVILERNALPGDPRGSAEFDLRDQSEFTGHVPSRRGYYGADYDTRETTAAHSGGSHRYRVSRSIIEADVFVNLPKWKTHKKAGITCSLKNLVGINTYKNFLPHHSEGTPSMGGDQFPSSDLRNTLETRILRRFKDTLLRNPSVGRLLSPAKRVGGQVFGETHSRVRNGSWYGNDTIWRMILDLNKLLLFGNPDGTIRRSGRKRYVTIVDGVVAGEGQGPEAPDRVEAGLIFGGLDPVSVDCAAARLMGFDYRRIPSLANAFAPRALPLVDFSFADIELASESNPAWRGPLRALPREACLHFQPHFGWRGHIESDQTAAA